MILDEEKTLLEGLKKSWSKYNKTKDKNELESLDTALKKVEKSIKDKIEWAKADKVKRKNGGKS